MNSSRLLISRQSCRLLHHRSSPSSAAVLPRSSAQRLIARPSSSSSKSSSATAGFSSNQPTAAAILLSTAALLYNNNNTNNGTTIFTTSECSVQLGAEATMLSPATEPKTGILFPRLCNGMTFVGCGVRVKYGFVKVSRIYIMRYVILY